MGQRWASFIGQMLLFTGKVDLEKDRMLIYGACYAALKQKGFFEAPEEEKRRIWRELFSQQDEMVSGEKGAQ
jgi:hypothetical protein